MSKFKDTILSPFKWGKNQAKTFTDWDQHFGKGGTVSELKKELDIKDQVINKKYRNETFQDATSRMNMTEADLKDSYDYYKNTFKLWFSLGILAILMIASIVIHKNYFIVFSGLAFIIIAFAFCYSASYRCYCINHRVLSGIDKWKKAGEWMPKPFVFKDKNQAIVYKERSLHRGKSSSSSSSSNKNRDNFKSIDGGKK